MKNSLTEYDVRAERFDTFVRAAMLENEERITSDEQDETLSADSRIPEKILSMYEKKVAEENKIRSIMQWKKRLKRCSMVAASVILVAALSISIAMAISENMRLAVARLVINHNQEKQMYTVSAVREEVTFEEIPKEWKGNYYLTYLPAGYELETAGKTYVDYYDPEIHWLKGTEKKEGIQTLTASISFREISDKSYHEFPEDKCYLEAIMLGNHSGIRAVYPEFDQLETILWSADGKIFEVSTYGVGLEETMKIVSGVYKIP